MIGTIVSAKAEEGGIMQEIKVPDWWLSATGGQKLAFLRKTGVDTVEDFEAVLRDEMRLMLTKPSKLAIEIPALIVKDPQRILSGNTLEEQVKELCSVAGVTNVINPWQTCRALGMQPPKSLALITTPLEIIERLAGSSEPGFFSWRASKLLPKGRKPKLTPISMKYLWENTTPRYQSKGSGKVLHSANDSDCWYGNEQFFTACDVKGKIISDLLPRSGWAWVTKSPVRSTKGETHPQQTGVFAAFLRDELFAGSVPAKLIQGLLEWNDKKEGLIALARRSEQEAARHLSAIAINRLRRNLAEMLWDTTLMRLVQGKKLLESEYDCSAVLLSHGDLVGFGACDADGGRVFNWTPHDVDDRTGACLSVGLENLVP
jgi:hypothetical protein